MKRAHALRLCLGLAACAVVYILPAVAMAGSISGTVTDDAVVHTPIPGIEVCSHVQPYAFEDSCTETNPGGTYSLTGLPQGDYTIHFSDFVHNRNYVDQYFDDKGEFGAANLVHVGTGQNVTGIDAEMHKGGTIAGTVTDAGSGNPVANFPVCARGETAFGEVGRCAHTDGSGNYAVNGLPVEEYEVEFFGEVNFNYLTQYYDDAVSSAAATLVPITGPGDIESSIDAAMKPGVEISGTLTEVGTHKPLPKVRVDLLEPGTEEVLRLTFTDADGHYAFRGQPAGTYVVAFSRPSGPFDNDGLSTQYYRGATSFAVATPLTVTPPDVLIGIDGEVVNERPPAGPQPIQVTIFPTSQPPPLPCRKGFHPKKVRGAMRCVKKHRRHHHRHHGKRVARRLATAR